MSLKSYFLEFMFLNGVNGTWSFHVHMSDQSLCLLISKVCMRLELFVNRKNGNSITLQVDVFVPNEILFRVIDGKVALQYQVGVARRFITLLRWQQSVKSRNINVWTIRG